MSNQSETGGASVNYQQLLARGASPPASSPAVILAAVENSGDGLPSNSSTDDVKFGDGATEVSQTRPALSEPADSSAAPYSSSAIVEASSSSATSEVSSGTVHVPRQESQQQTVPQPLSVQVNDDAGILPKAADEAIDSNGNNLSFQVSQSATTSVVGSVQTQNLAQTDSTLESDRQSGQALDTGIMSAQSTTAPVSGAAPKQMTQALQPAVDPVQRNTTSSESSASSATPKTNSLSRHHHGHSQQPQQPRTAIAAPSPATTTTRSNGSESYAVHPHAPVHQQAASIHLQQQNQQSQAPPPPPPQSDQQQYYEQGGIPPLCSSPAQASAQQQQSSQILKKKGRFTFMEASPHQSEDGRKTLDLLDSTEPAREVRKGRFLLTKQDKGDASGTVSLASQGSYNLTPGGTPEGTPGPPTMKKKGRFVITNVGQVVAGGVSVQPVAAQPVQPRPIMPYQSQPQEAPQQYEYQTHACHLQSIPQQGDVPAPAFVPHQAAPTFDGSIQYVTQHEHFIAQQQAGLVAPARTPPPPPPPPPTPAPLTALPPAESTLIHPQAVQSNLMAPERDNQAMAAGPSPANDVQQEQKTQQEQFRKAAPRSTLPRNSAVGYAGREGLGKVFYFLEQMRLEVSDADSSIKKLQTDNRCLKDKNKELEGKLRESERKLKDEKVLRENAEAKVKALKKKLRGTKGDLDKEITLEDQKPPTHHRRPSSEGSQSAKAIEKRLFEAGAVAKADEQEVGGGSEKTPIKAAVPVAKNAKPSPENQIGGTPPRDPNSINYSTSPIPNRTHAPPSTAPGQKVPIMNNNSAIVHESSFAPLQASPDASPEKNAVQQNPLLPGLSPGGTASLRGSHHYNHTNGNGWPYQHQAASDPSMANLFGAEPRQDVAASNSVGSASAAAKAAEFDPLRRTTTGLETIEGMALPKRLDTHAAAPAFIATRSMSNGLADRNSSHSMGYDFNNDGYSLQELKQPSLSDPQPTRPDVDLFAAPPSNGSDHFHTAHQQQQQQERSLQQHGRAMSLDALPQWGIPRSSSDTFHNHSGSHESLLAPKMNESSSNNHQHRNPEPASDPFEQLMSNISPGNG